MTRPEPPPTTGDDATLASEMAAIPYEPLLPIEQQWIAGSLLLGVALLGLLLWASTALFPVSAASPGKGSRPRVGWQPAAGPAERPPLPPRDVPRRPSP